MNFEDLLKQEIKKEQLKEFIFFMRKIQHYKPCVLMFIRHNHNYIPTLIYKLKKGEGKSECYMQIHRGFFHLMICLQKRVITKLLRSFYNNESYIFWIIGIKLGDIGFYVFTMSTLIPFMIYIKAFLLKQ